MFENFSNNTCLVFGVVYGFIIFVIFDQILHRIIKAHTEKSILKGDKDAKVYNAQQAKAIQDTGKEQMLKLDFKSLINDMERYYKLNRGKRIANRIGVWINWTKAILKRKEISL